MEDITRYTTATTVFVTTSFIGFHAWYDAPRHRAYLAARHRHKFGVRLEISTLHHDRELEYHDLKDILDAKCKSGSWHEGYSCEMIAEHLLRWVMEQWPNRPFYSVTVDEDGENGSTVTAQAGVAATLPDYDATS